MTIPIRQASWATIEYLAYPVAMFALAPFFVSRLGVHGYGLWMMLIALSGLGGVAGLGMGAATTREIASIRGAGDLGRAGEVLLTALIAIICGCVVLGVAYGTSWYLLPAQAFERIGALNEIALLLLTSLVVVFLEQVESVFSGAIRGAERFDLSSRAEVLSKFVAIGLCAACALLSTSLAAFFAVVALGAAFRVMVKVAVATRLLGSLRLDAKCNWVKVRAMMAFGSWVCVQAFGSFMFVAADRLLIGSLIGSAAVAVYATLTQLAQQIHAIPAAGASVLFPLVSRMRSEGRSVRRSVRGALLLVLAVALLLAAPVWLLGDRIVALWMGDSFAGMGVGAIGVLALAYMLLAVSVVPYYVLLALGSVRAFAILNLGAGAIGLLFCWMVVPTFGLVGAAWAKVVYGVLLIIGLVTIAWWLDGKGERSLAPVQGGLG
jgi:O-antigen/teichoic acid export membrane protein